MIGDCSKDEIVMILLRMIALLAIANEGAHTQDTILQKTRVGKGIEDDMNATILFLTRRKIEERDESSDTIQRRVNPMKFDHRDAGGTIPIQKMIRMMIQRKNACLLVTKLGYKTIGTLTNQNGKSKKRKQIRMFANSKFETAKLATAQASTALSQLASPF